MVACPVNTASATLEANPRPASEDPAWIRTGWPCTDREYVQRSLDRVKLSLVVNPVHLLRIEKHPGFLVPDKRVVLP